MNTYELLFARRRVFIDHILDAHDLVPHSPVHNPQLLSLLLFGLLPLGDFLRCRFNARKSATTPPRTFIVHNGRFPLLHRGSFGLGELRRRSARDFRSPRWIETKRIEEEPVLRDRLLALELAIVS